MLSQFTTECRFLQELVQAEYFVSYSYFLALLFLCTYSFVLFIFISRHSFCASSFSLVSVLFNVYFVLAVIKMSSTSAQICLYLVLLLPLKSSSLIITSITKQNTVVGSKSPCLTPEFISIFSVKSFILTLAFVCDNANLTNLITQTVH